MSEIMKSQIADVCSDKKLKDSMMVEVESWVSATFNELGYHPRNLKKSIDEAWHNADVEESIADFVFDVWRIDS